MPRNTQLDGRGFEDIRFPYDRISAELSEKPRLIRGLNMYVTRGGKLSKRPGTLAVANTTSTLRADRFWMYETEETPSKLYILGTFFDVSTGLWALYYNRPAAASGWVSAGATRSLSASTRLQHVTFSRGKAYVKSFPATASSDKFGTAVLDGTGGAITAAPWGLPAPTEPAHISGRVTRLSATINSSTTAINVVANFSPTVTPPFTIQVDFEQMSVTSVGGGTNWTVTRGINGTTPAAHDDDTIVLYRDWSASDHRVDVTQGWAYVYAWESTTGQISNRSPLETNFDQLPSKTGPFFDLIPKITVQGNADTTNIPFIRVYRTRDGGGIWYFLEKLANTGAGNITYLDDSLETGSAGGIFNDPVPDDVLDETNVAPSLTSNTAPPTVLSPGVIGVDTPAAATPIVAFSERFWFAIGNVVFYSGQEEISEGIPEECWPSGITGNFFRYPHTVVNLQATTNAVYIQTRRGIHVITGTNRETFSSRPLYENIGGLADNPRASTAYGQKVAFFTHDLRIVLTDGSREPLSISDPLFTDLRDWKNLSSAMQLELTYWADLDKEWLIASAHHQTDPTISRHWVYDITLSRETGQHFWFVPWQISTTALYSGKIAEDSDQQRLCFYIFNATPAAETGRFVRLDPTGRTATDITTTGSVVGMDYYADTFLHLVPSGNHVNQLRVPALVPVFEYLIIERTLSPGDEDPEFFFYLDDFWTDPISAEFIEDPARDHLSKAYKTMVVHLHRAAKRVAWRVQGINSTTFADYQNYAMVWHPDGGA